MNALLGTDQPLVKVVLETTLLTARNSGATRALALVPRGNARSIRMVTPEGFVPVRTFDQDCDEYAIRLA